MCVCEGVRRRACMSVHTHTLLALNQELGKMIAIVTWRKSHFLMWKAEQIQMLQTEITRFIRFIVMHVYMYIYIYACMIVCMYICVFVWQACRYLHAYLYLYNKYVCKHLCIPDVNETFIYATSGDFWHRITHLVKTSTILIQYGDSFSALSPYFLTEVMHCCLNSGIVPHARKTGKMIYIFKKEENYYVINYRPQSTLPHFSKFYEK